MPFPVSVRMEGGSKRKNCYFMGINLLHTRESYSKGDEEIKLKIFSNFESIIRALMCPRDLFVYFSPNCDTTNSTWLSINSDNWVKGEKMSLCGGSDWLLRVESFFLLSSTLLQKATRPAFHTQTSKGKSFCTNIKQLSTHILPKLKFSPSGILTFFALEEISQMLTQFSFISDLVENWELQQEHT